MTITHTPIVRLCPEKPVTVYPLQTSPEDHEIARRILDCGGCTSRVSPSGKILDAATGYGLSIFKDREVVVPIVDFSAGHIAAYRDLNADLLGRDEVYVGGWFNNEDGNVYLDCSIVVNDLGVARAAASAASQLAIWDLGNKEEIRL
jgi:hypothetical protein